MLSSNGPQYSCNYSVVAGTERHLHVGAETLAMRLRGVLSKVRVHITS